MRREYKGVYFEKIKSIVIEDYLFSNDNIPVTINFDYSSILFHNIGRYSDDYGGENVNVSREGLDKITLAVPKVKAASIIKAFERLKEIAKEESKDPFAE